MAGDGAETHQPEQGMQFALAPDGRIRRRRSRPSPAGFSGGDRGGGRCVVRITGPCSDPPSRGLHMIAHRSGCTLRAKLPRLAGVGMHANPRVTLPRCTKPPKSWTGWISSCWQLLQADGRVSVQDLADRVGLSASQCSRRRARLEDAGVIAGYPRAARPGPAGIGRDGVRPRDTWRGTRRTTPGCSASLVRADGQRSSKPMPSRATPTTSCAPRVPDLRAHCRHW